MELQFALSPGHVAFRWRLPAQRFVAIGRCRNLGRHRYAPHDKNPGDNAGCQ